MMRYSISPHPTIRRPAAVILVAAAISLGAACGGGDDASDAPTASLPTTTAPAVDPPVTAVERAVDLFFLSADGRLAKRVVIAQAGEELVTAMNALAEGPREPGLVPALPAGTEVRDVSLADGTARVDLSSAFVTGYPSGGSAAELEVLAPIVYTLTAVPGVSRVLITADGATPDLPGSAFGFGQPLTRADLPAELAP